MLTSGAARLALPLIRKEIPELPIQAIVETTSPEAHHRRRFMARRLLRFRGIHLSRSEMTFIHLARAGASQMSRATVAYEYTKPTLPMTRGLTSSAAHPARPMVFRYDGIRQRIFA